MTIGCSAYTDDRNRAAEMISETLRDNAVHTAIFRVIWSDGTIHWLGSRGHAILDENGQPERLVGMSVDVTEPELLRHSIERQLTLLRSALLPAVPSSYGNYRTASVYLPQSSGDSIGGDFYDVFKTELGEVAVMIGDVEGKGIETASLAVAARNTIRAFAYDSSSPGAALSRAAAVLQEEVDESERFVTAMLVLVDPASGRLTYARAGHPPAAIRRSDGRVEFLEDGGSLIGVPASSPGYADFTGQLGPGDQIVLYTDGIFEARRGSECFEAEGIGSTLAGLGDAGPQELAQGLLDAAHKWTESGLQDDAAIVVLQRQ